MRWRRQGEQRADNGLDGSETRVMIAEQEEGVHNLYTGLTRDEVRERTVIYKE